MTAPTLKEIQALPGAQTVIADGEKTTILNPKGVYDGKFYRVYEISVFVPVEENPPVSAPARVDNQGVSTAEMQTEETSCKTN